MPGTRNAHQTEKLIFSLMGVCDRMIYSYSPLPIQRVMVRACRVFPALCIARYSLFFLCRFCRSGLAYPLDVLTGPQHVIA